MDFNVFSGNHMSYSSETLDQNGGINGGYHYENSDSDDELPQELNGRGAPSADTKKRQAQEETVRNRISQAKQRGSVILELNSLGVQNIPPELLELANLECLYLEDNELTSLPENFFDCLPNLKWLDLRQNYLTSIPSTYIGRHRCLRNLLLEGNDLKTLPLELGLVTTLNGLNIANNPLEFPPESVIEGGTKSILAFFRDLLRAKSEAGYAGSEDPSLDSYVEDHLTTADKENTQNFERTYTWERAPETFSGRVPNNVLLPRIEDMRLAESEEGYSSGSEEFFGHKSRNNRNSAHRPSLQHQSSHDSARDSEDDLIGPVPHSASLHKQMTYNELRQMQIEKLKKAGAFGTLDKKSRFYPHVIAPSQTRFTGGERVRKKKKKRKQPRDYHVSQYPEPPPPDRVELRYREERQLARLREVKEKQDMILQKRKDNEALRQWRGETKQLQNEKYREAYIYGGAKDPVDVAKQSPFGVSNDHMKVPTNEERIARDVRDKHEKMRRVMSPASRRKLELARLQKEKELEGRIKEHTRGMQERRRKPKGSPQEEMQAARRELEVAEQLQHEIELRRKELEYRFTAFTGDPR